MVKVRKTRLEQLSSEGNSTAKLALKMTDDINDMLAAAQLGITIASVGLGWVGAKTIADILHSVLVIVLPFADTAFCLWISVPLSFILITYFEVLLGEQIPKCVALQNPEKATLMVARPMKLTMIILKPFVWFLATCGNKILEFFKLETCDNQLVHTTEELDMLVDASYNEGVLNETEAEMLHNMFKFSDLTAKQVMIPRTDMMCIEPVTPVEDIKKFTAENQYTRYPVYEESIDRIIGFLHVKDLYTKLLENDENINIKELLRPIMLIPETMTLDNLVIEFRKRKSQIGIVVDEFGGTSGLVTLEDVLEEIVGEVQDEFDEDEELDIKEVAPDTYIASAMVRIDEIAEFFDIEENNFNFEDVETIGGLVVKILGRIAQVGDVVEIEEQGLKFTVQKVDGARVT
ncbi:MAG: hemolysin family protein, partial [Candidatus Gastranaerophilales bacterium]|nr:hemolysin family protein [Candidatus Gastranaerophilales bacterium]